MESKAGSNFLFCRASFRKTAPHFSGRRAGRTKRPKPPYGAAGRKGFFTSAGGAGARSCSRQVCGRSLDRLLLTGGRASGRLLAGSENKVSAAEPRSGGAGIEIASALAPGAAARKMAPARKRRTHVTKQLIRITSPLAGARTAPLQGQPSMECACTYNRAILSRPRRIASTHFNCFQFRAVRVGKSKNP